MIVYVCLGLLCLCTAALLVNASTTGKPRPGFNGPLALQEEIRWLEANGLPVPLQAKHLLRPSSPNRHGLPMFRRDDLSKAEHSLSKVLPLSSETAVKKTDIAKPKPAPTGRHRLMAASNGQKTTFTSLERSKHPTMFVPRPNRTPRRTLDTDIWIQDFEGGAMPPTGWSVIVSNSNWTWGDSTTQPYEGTYHAFCAYDPDANAQDEWFVSPVVDLTAITEPICVLSFHWYASYYWAVTMDNYDLEVRISTDGGTTWEATSLWSEDSIGTFSSFTYYLAEVDLSAYLTYNNVKFAWRYAGTDGAEASVDYIRLISRTPCVTCSATDSVEAAETADSTWMASDPNGGCNNTDGNYLYDSTACGDTLCGQCFTYVGPNSGLYMRDTDWFRFTVTSPETVSVWILAEFPVKATIFTDDCENLEVLADGTSDYCVPLEFGVCLEAGSYLLSLGPSVDSGIETPMPYRAALKCNGTCTPPPHYDCAAPYILPTETGTFTGLSTCDATNDYENTCLDVYDNGEDVILQWTVTTAGTYRIWLDPQGTTWTGIVVDDECPPAPGGCMGMSTQWDETPHAIACRGYAPGTYYIMVDTYPEPDCIPTFDITIETCSLVGACCYGDPLAPTCETDSLSQCDALRGTWHEGEDCATFECPLPPMGACCYGNPYTPACIDTYEIGCEALGGTWYSDTECATFTCPVPPVNDTCGAAILVNVPSTTAGTTKSALVDDWAPYCITPITSGGVWYKLIGTGTTIAATTCGQEYEWDTKLSVYCGSCEDFQCIIADDDSCSVYGLHSTVVWCAELGITYHILVHGFSAANGDFTLQITEDGVPCEPTIRCYCTDPDSVTAYKVADGVDVRFFAPEAGVYYVWTTTAKNNDGNPDNGLDLDFALGTSLISMTGSEYLSWVDTSVTNYENYVVTSKCGPVGRCCYGPDPENLSCADVPRVICEALGGTWKSSMTCELFPCNCPTGSTPEGEPECYDGYVDVTNGGCNADLQAFGTISCGETICGTSGYYETDGSTWEDADWFELVTSDEGDTIIWTVRAEFDVYIGIISGTCDDQTWLSSVSGSAGQAVSCSTICVHAGTYWLRVAPSNWDNVSCGSRWFGTVTCIPCTPPPAYDCTAPYVLPTETGTFTGLSTCGAGDDYSSTCLDWYDSDEDIIFEWTVTTAGDYIITLDPLGTYYTGIVVDDECPPAETGCLGVHTNWDSTTHSIPCQHYDAGTYYIMVDSWTWPPCIPSFNLMIDTCTAAVCIPDFTLEGPGTVSGNTCGAGNDCATRATEDQIVAVTLAAEGDYTFTLCNTTPTRDTYLYLDMLCCGAGHIDEDDDGCSTLLSRISAVHLTAGTYYVLIEAFDTSSVPNCGAWTLDVIDVSSEYCLAEGGCDEYIGQVVLGSIDNSTDCDNYADYTAQSTTMSIGGSYTLTVTNGNPYDVDECGAWIDWNDDLDFDDDMETITMSGSPGEGPYTATIMPVLGQDGTHRLRIRITYDQTPASCGEDTFGEVEDYTIIAE
jgi:hypothetical protein